MRITSGKFRGRRLISPNSDLTHPMGDREKLALFNSLASHGSGSSSSSNSGSSSAAMHSDNSSQRTFSLSGAHVLDLFAGSGALGLEALSRGALDVDLVENSHQATKAIRGNIDALGVSARVKLFPQSAEVFLAYALTNTKKYDLILIDPPYDKFAKIFEASIFSNLSDLLTPNGKLVLSHPSLVPPAELFPGLKPQTSRKYARANISIYEKLQ